MDQPIGQEPASQARQKSKMIHACDPCRASKVKCQPGAQPGICKRCSEYKRECIFRTGPRTRRPKASSRPDTGTPPVPPPPGPSKTFSIDFNMPATEDPSADFAELRLNHDRFIADLVPSSDDEDEGEDGYAVLTSPSAQVVGEDSTFSFNDMTTSTPSSTTTASTHSRRRRPIASLGIKPQFNLDSASKLLASFRDMLPHCPCVVLPEGVDVRSMARDAPFVLLAILAVTSTSTSLQGHSLYDEEFRKILGLKFVAGGERSLELLQGLLIYCSWYPFHLRPKNRQLLQYMRMAVDIAHDLEMDEEAELDLASQPTEVRDHRLSNIRAYLACFYVVSTYSCAWPKPSIFKYTPWIAKCCTVLEQGSALDQDHVLVWLVRLQSIIDELNEVRRSPRDQRHHQGPSEYHRNLIRMGLETQLQELLTKIPEWLSTTPSIFMSALTAKMLLSASPLMHPRRPRAGDLQAQAEPPPDPAKLLAATHTLRVFFDHITATAAAAAIGRFCGADYVRLIASVILAYRLAFPVPLCPGYDFARGRRVLEFGTVLRKLSGVDDGADGEEEEGASLGADARAKGTNTDCVAALRVVLGSLRDNFERKSAALHVAATAAAEEEASGRKAGSACPMLDGSLDQYIPLWEGQQGNHDFFASSNAYVTPSQSAGDPGMLTGPGTGTGIMGAQTGTGETPVIFHDLWATMTMGWSTTDMGLGEVDLTGTGVDMGGGGGGNGAGYDNYVNL